MTMTTSLSRFAVVTLISLSFLANICIAAIQPYIIYPAPNINQIDSDSLSNDISLVSAKFYDYTRWKRTIPEFWVAWLTPEAYQWFKDDKRVNKNVVLGAHSTNRREQIRDIHLSKVLAEPAVSADSTFFNITSPVEAPSEVEADISVGANPIYTTQALPKATDLRVLSQPPGFISWSRYKNFVYTTGGAGAYIYHAELGVTGGLDVAKSRIEWLYTPAVIFSGKAKHDESRGPGLPFGHSTCTASKAAGIGYGAAKEAKLVVVKMLDYNEPSVTSVLKVIADDVKKKGRGGKSVVSISWSTTAPVSVWSNDPWLAEMRGALEELYQLNVIVVCSAGNFGEYPFRTLVDTAPGMFINHVITVGASYFNGQKWGPSQSLAVPQLYAPGVEILCADASGQRAYSTDSGTSFCELQLITPSERTFKPVLTLHFNQKLLHL